MTNSGINHTTGSTSKKPNYTKVTKKKIDYSIEEKFKKIFDVPAKSKKATPFYKTRKRRNVYNYEYLAEDYQPYFGTFDDSKLNVPPILMNKKRLACYQKDTILDLSMLNSTQNSWLLKRTTPKNLSIQEKEDSLSQNMSKTASPRLRKGSNAMFGATLNIPNEATSVAGSVSKKNKEKKLSLNKKNMSKTIGPDGFRPKKMSVTISDVNNIISPNNDVKAVPNKDEETVPNKDEKTVPNKDEKTVPYKDENGEQKADKDKKIVPKIINPCKLNTLENQEDFKQENLISIQQMKDYQNYDEFNKQYFEPQFDNFENSVYEQPNQSIKSRIRKTPSFYNQIKLANYAKNDIKNSMKNPKYLSDNLGLSETGRRIKTPLTKSIGNIKKDNLSQCKDSNRQQSSSKNDSKSYTNAEEAQTKFRHTEDIKDSEPNYFNMNTTATTFRSNHIQGVEEYLGMKTKKRTTRLNKTGGFSYGREKDSNTNPQIKERPFSKFFDPFEKFDIEDKTNDEDSYGGEDDLRSRIIKKLDSQPVELTMCDPKDQKIALLSGTQLNEEAVAFSFIEGYTKLS